MTTEKFTFFWGGVFSNWYQATIIVDGVEYKCVEQYMMSEKAKLFKDFDSYEKIMQADHPREQKRLGRKVKGFDVAQWDKVSRNIVYIGCYVKFLHPHLKEKLLATEGTTLVEASPYDKIWGIGLDVYNPLILDRATWKGLNWLGEVLTKVREDIKQKGN